MLMLGSVIAIMSAFQFAMLASVKAREQLYSGRLLEMAFSKIKSIDYYMLFAADSSDLVNFRMSTGTFQGSTVYPYRATLTQVHNACRLAGLNHFTIDVVFMRRDTTDVLGTGSLNALIPFTDADGDLIDDYDSSIRFFDQNTDGDFYDTYILDGRRISEQPDTHLKEVTVSFWKKGSVLARQTELLSLEQFSGVESPASGAALKFFMAQPPNSSALYNLASPDRDAAFISSITKTYPTSVEAYRADNYHALRLSGETDPQAEARFYVNDTLTQIDIQQADITGSFDFQSSLATFQLVEGQNRLWGRATKDANYSPWAFRDVVYDLNPPEIYSPVPVGVVKNRAPRVGAHIKDTGISTTVVSGVCPEVITMKIDGNAVTHSYNSVTGEVIWVDPVSWGPPVLSTGSYIVTLEGGDRAYYKVISTWSFTVEIEEPDHSPPAISQKSPIGACQTQIPVISVKIFDNQSGIDPYSITLKLDGNIVVNASNVGGHYDPQGGYLTYVPTSPMADGTFHTVEVTASHWATSPPDKVTSTDSWNFFINLN